jgi:hypothetical protein
MNMCVRDAYFASVSMIVLFDFGIVLTVWDCSDSVGLSHTGRKIPHCQNNPTLSEQYHTVRTIPHCQNNPTLAEQSHTVRTIPHCQNNTTLSEQYHTVRTIPHCQNIEVLLPSQEHERSCICV